MILQSNREMDVVFVSKAIQEHNLEPQPVSGFHAERDYWVETERWKRVVERYPWGSVLYLSDRQRGQSVTIVAVGKVDLETGKVSTQGGHQQIPPSWYPELAKDLRDAMKPDATLQIPPCLGFHESDHVCDGGVDSGTKKIEPACAWRNRCIAFQDYCGIQNRHQEDVLKSKSPEQIIQLTTRLLEKRGGKVSAPPNGASKAKSVKSSQKSSDVVSAVAPAAETGQVGADTSMLQLLTSVISDIAAEAGLKAAPDCSKATATPGDLYMVDRTEHSDYISLYQDARPRPIALASFRIRPRMGGFVVQLPIPVGHKLLEPIVSEDVKAWKDGAFQSGVSHVPTSGLRLDHIKHIIAELLKK